MSSFESIVVQTTKVEYRPTNSFSFCVPGFRVILGKSNILDCQPTMQYLQKTQKIMLKEVDKTGMCNKQKKPLSINAGIFNHFFESVLAIKTIKSSYQDDT